VKKRSILLVLGEYRIGCEDGTMKVGESRGIKNHTCAVGRNRELQVWQGVDRFSSCLVQRV